MHELSSQICEAIRSKRILTFTYDGLYREIEPHIYGTSSQDKETVNGHQTAGQSHSGSLGWRAFDVQKIQALQVSQATFAAPRPTYKRTGEDNNMAKVHCLL